MATLTLTAKGQLTLKQELLRHLGVCPGQKLEVEKLSNGEIIVRAAPKESIQNVFGCLNEAFVASGQPMVSIEDMNQAIAQGWAAKADKK